MLHRARDRGGLLHRGSRYFDVGHRRGIVDHFGSGRRRRGPHNRFLLLAYTIVLRRIFIFIEDTSHKMYQLHFGKDFTHETKIA